MPQCLREKERKRERERERERNTLCPSFCVFRLFSDSGNTRVCGERGEEVAASDERGNEDERFNDGVNDWQVFQKTSQREPFIETLMVNR